MAERMWAREFARMRAVAWKDLAVERRTKANFNAVVFFAALTLLLFGFALGADTDAIKAASSGVLWLTVLFSGVLVFNRSYQTELDTGALELLLLYPGERWAIFAGKLIANLAFVLLVEAVILPLAVVLYHMPLERAPWSIIMVMLLGTLGFVTLGTFYAAMASRVRAREVLLPLLLFPMLVPVLIAAVQATSAFLTGDVMGDSRVWVRLLLVFDAIFLVAALVAFEHVIEG
jgi:heme exporter protein B